MHYYIVSILYYTVGSIVLKFGIFGPLEGSQSKGISGSWPHGCLTSIDFKLKNIKVAGFWTNAKANTKTFANSNKKNRCLL